MFVYCIVLNILTQENTVCPRSLDSFYVETYYIRGVKTSLTYSISYYIVLHDHKEILSEYWYISFSSLACTKCWIIIIIHNIKIIRYNYK